MRKQLAAVMFASLLTACVMEGEPADYRVTADEFAATISNGMTTNALTKNALTKNALTKNALTKNALTKNALEANALTSTALRDDPDARTALSYIYSCAMPAASTMTLSFKTWTGRFYVTRTYSFSGGLGLAPQWGAGECDQSCQRWVSACVLSRLNTEATPVALSLRAQHPMLASWSAQEGLYYTKREATFYGNIFAEPMQMYACDDNGLNFAPAAPGRVCASNNGLPGSEPCPITVTGFCTQYRPEFATAGCSASGNPSYYGGCNSPVGPFTEVITDFLYQAPQL